GPVLRARAKSSDGVPRLKDRPEGRTGFFFAGPVGRAAAARGVRCRRSARVVAPTAKPARAKHSGFGPRPGSRERVQGRARQVRDRWAVGQVSIARRAFPSGRGQAMRTTATPAKAAGTAAPDTVLRCRGRGRSRPTRTPCSSGRGDAGRTSGGSLRVIPADDAAQSDPRGGSPAPLERRFLQNRARETGCRSGRLPLPGTGAGASRPTAWTQRRQGVSPPDM